jgi:hypothetical protein
MLPSILVKRSEKEFTCPSSHAKDATTIGITAFSTSDQFMSICAQNLIVPDPVYSYIYLPPDVVNVGEPVVEIAA